MEDTNQQQAYQVQLRHVLDTHLAPLLKDEWKPTLSFYDAGAKPSETGEGLSVVVVWMRSMDIVPHTEELLKRCVVDPVERIDGAGTGHPKLEDCTLMVRLYKRVDETDLFLNLFQIFGDEDDGNGVYDELLKICSKSKN